MSANSWERSQEKMGSLYVQDTEGKAAKAGANRKDSTEMPPSIDSALDTQDLAN